MSKAPIQSTTGFRVRHGITVQGSSDLEDHLIQWSGAGE